MAYKTPGIYFTEIDNTEYTNPAAEINTTVAIVGYATKGPIEVPTEITSYNDFKKTFGSPIPGQFSGMAVKSILASGGTVLFVRVSNEATQSFTQFKFATKEQLASLVINSTDPIVVGTEGYENGAVYTASVAEGANQKEITIRTPSSGKLTLNSILTQLNDSFASTEQLVEFNVSDFSTEKYTDITISAGSDINSEKQTIFVKPASLTPAGIKAAIPSSGQIYNVHIASFNSITTGSHTFSIDETTYTFNVDTTGYTFEDVISKMNEAVSSTDYRIQANDTGFVVFNTGSTSAGIECKLTLPSGETYLTITGPGDPVSNTNSFVSSILTEDNTNTVVVKVNFTDNNLVLGDSVLGTTLTPVQLQTANLNTASTLVAKKNSDGKIYICDPTVKSTSISISYETLGTTKSLEPIFGGTQDYDETDPKGVYTYQTDYTAAVSSDSNDKLLMTAIEYGSGTTNISTALSTVVSPVDGTETKTFYVFVDGNQKESWDVSLDSTDDNYIETLVNDLADNGGSSYIQVKVNKAASHISTIADIIDFSDIYIGKTFSIDGETAVSGTDYNLGVDGIPTTASAQDTLFEEALDSSESGLSNKDLYSWHILITPDNIDEDVQNAAIALCEAMDDGMYIADTPQGLTRDQAVNWLNGKSNRSTALTSNYVASYWPWCKTYDSTSSKYVWTMPSIIMAAQYCLVDKYYYPWYAPAGQTCGVVSTVLDIEEHPNKNDRDKMYLNGNTLNPFLMLNDGTIMAYGEKTCQRKNSVLSKVHTRRMLIALKKEIRAALRGFIFLPTMTSNITSINAAVTAIMEKYKTGGGVNSYKVICDDTNNTTETLQQDIVNISVVMVPTGCIEQIEVSFTLNKSDESAEA